MDAGAIDRVTLKDTSPWGFAESMKKVLKCNQVWIQGFKPKSKRLHLGQTSGL